MQKFADIAFKDNKFHLTGDLDFSNVMTIYNKSLKQMRDQSTLTFDFAALKSSNSAGFALLIEWIKFAKKNNLPIYFENLTQDILAIAKTTGIDKLIANMQR